MSAPRGEELIDADFAERWDKATRKLCKVSKKNYNDLKKPISVADVLGIIGDNKSKKEEAASKHQKAKEVLGKTLECLQTLGQLAIQGVSMVFGPADLAFNGVMFLVERAKHFGKVFTGVSNLFERICAFLERFQVYVRSKSLDKYLKNIINDLLECFIEICCLAIELAQQPKVITFLKVFAFDEDFGIQGHLDKLENTVARELGMTVALILESQQITEATVVRTEAVVVQISGDMEAGFQSISAKTDHVAKKLGGVIDRMESAEQRKQTVEEERKRQETVRTALKIDEKENLSADLEDYIKSVTPETGKWLVSGEDSFTSWSEVGRSEAPIFALEAKEGYGKSYLTSTVIRHLQKRYRSGQDGPRVAVAYHFFEKDSKNQNNLNKSSSGKQEKSNTDSTSGLDKSSNLNKCLKSIIWQLTRQDRGFEMSVAKRCTNKEEFADTLFLWDHLIKKLANTDATFFIVLDGIDDCPSEKGNPLAQMLQDVVELSSMRDSQLRLKIFLTGRPMAFDSIPSAGLDHCMTRIALGVRNKDDIVQYIEMSMDSIKALKNKSEPQVETLRQRIIDDLTAGAAGDFVKVRYKLEEISGMHRISSIEEVLSHAAEDRMETIGREIKTLNESLPPEDIKDLNMLLVWVIGGRRYFTVETMEQVLLLKDGQKSLIRLEEQITQEFSNILDTYLGGEGETRVTIRSDSIEEYLRKQHDDPDDTGAENAPVHPKEVAIVQRVLRMACDEDLYEKFGFDRFFEKRLGNRDGIIHVEFDTMHLQIVLSLLEVMVSKAGDSDFKELAEYGHTSLAVHIMEVNGNPVSSKAASDLKREIGPLLIRLFQDEDTINSWWSEEMMDWLRDVWLDYGDQYAYLQAVLTFLKDPGVSRDLTTEQKSWVSKLAARPGADEIHLFQPTMIIIARRWLQSNDRRALENFQWLRQYLDLAVVQNGATNFTSITVEQIREVEKFARDALDMKEDTVTSAIKIAITYREQNFYDEALEWYKVGLEKDPLFWRVTYGIALTQQYQKKYAEAIETVLPLKKRLFKEKFDTDDEEETYFDIVEILAESYSALGQAEDAMREYRTLIPYFKDNYNRVLDAIRELKAKERHNEITEILEFLKERPSDTGLSQLVSMYLEYATWPIFHDTVNWALEKSEKQLLAMETFQIAIAAAEDDSARTVQLASLRHWYAHTLFTYWKGPEKEAEAISIWEQNFAFGFSHDDLEVEWTCFRMTGTQLGSVYLQKARQAVDVDKSGVEDYAKKLEYICTSQSAKYGDAPMDTSLLLARLYSLSGKQQEARKQIRHYIRSALEILSDEDPDNDHDGFKSLAVALSPIDDVNALAAWSLLGPDDPPTEEEEQEEKKEEGSEAGSEKQEASAAEDDNAKEQAQETNSNQEKKAPVERTGQLGYSCDGSCGHRWTYADDMYVCKDCVDTQYTEACLEKVTSGEMARKGCQPNHDFLHVPKWDDEAHKEIPKDSVKVGEQILSIKDWLKQLRVDYGIEATAEA